MAPRSSVMARARSGKIVSNCPATWPDGAGWANSVARDSCCDVCWTDVSNSAWSIGRSWVDRDDMRWRSDVAVRLDAAAMAETWVANERFVAAS